MESPSTIVRAGKVIAGIAFLLAAPISGYFLLQMFLEAHASAHWPSVSGTMIRAEIHETGSALEKRYETFVSYKYVVNGQDFAGTRIRTSDGELPDRRSAEDYLGSLAPGQMVKIYFNPADPSKSVLKNGAGYQECALLAVPFIMLALGLIGLWWGMRAGRPTTEPQLLQD